MPTPATYSVSGSRITVNSMIRDPLLIRQRFLQMSDQQFIMDTLLRNAGSADAGVVQYFESTPLFTDDDAAVVGEAGEIPLTVGQDGVPKAAFTIKTARGIEISREMRDRNRMDLLNIRMTQVRNTIVRHWETRLFNALAAGVPAANVLDLTGSTAVKNWVTGSAPTIRTNILDAMALITEAKVAGQTNSFLGFNPDTLVISTRARYAMMKDTAFGVIYTNSPLAERAPTYTGQLERDVLGLTVLASRFLTDKNAYLVESKTVGGFADERPLQVSPTYPDNPREVWRSDVVRRTAIFLDQPLAIAQIKGIEP